MVRNPMVQHLSEIAAIKELRALRAGKEVAAFVSRLDPDNAAYRPSSKRCCLASGRLGKSAISA